MNLDDLIKLHKKTIRDVHGITEEQRLKTYASSDAGGRQLDAEIELLEGVTADEFKFLDGLVIEAAVNPSPVFIEIYNWIKENQKVDCKYPDKIEGNQFIALVLKGLFMEGDVLPSMRKKKASQAPTRIPDKALLELFADMKATDVSKAAVKHGIGRQTAQARLTKFAKKHGLTYLELKAMSVREVTDRVYKL